MSRAQRRGTNSDIGHLAECRAAEWLDEHLGLVPDRYEDVPAQNCLDGVILRPIIGDEAGEIVPTGTPVEVKAAAFRTTDQDTSRRGRFQIRRYAHDWLLEHDGEYVVLVYDPESLIWQDDRVVDVDGWLAVRLVPATTVDAVIKTWTKDGLEDVARVPWSRLMDPERVSPEDSMLVADGGLTRQAPTDRAHRARLEPLDAERIAPGLFEVKNHRSGTHYRVDIGEPACECADFEYRMRPAGGECKHIHFLKQISTGDLCPSCGYAICRPSCPRRERSDRTELREGDAVAVRESSHEVLGAVSDAPDSVVKARCPIPEKRAHLDNGSSHEQLQRVQRAKEAMPSE